MTSLLKLYKLALYVATPLLVAHVKRRRGLGKEDPARYTERFGQSTLPRPKGSLTWFHGASVGECVSLLPVIKSMAGEGTILVTSGTLTSAQLMAKKLEEIPEVIHQFIPLDHPLWVKRFLNHWNPQQAYFVESDIWPSILLEVHRRRIPMTLLNARMTSKSLDRWLKFPKTAKAIFSLFDKCCAPTQRMEEALKALGAQTVERTKHLKLLADPLPVAPHTLKDLLDQLGNRPRWVAASTHEGEEQIVLNAHRVIAQKLPKALTIIVPRHPHRGDQLAQMMREQGFTVAQRSKGEKIEASTQIHLADTLGELGLFYTVCPVAFIGATLMPIGGHNPIEAIQLQCTPLWGPHIFKSEDLFEVIQTSSDQLITQETLGERVLEILICASSNRRMI